MSTVAAPPRAQRPSALGLLASTDHKSMGLLTGITAVGFFFLAGLLALLMRAELASPGLQVVSFDTYNQVFSMHGSTMFYLFAAPVTMAVGLYLVPLQVGAPGVTWPRLALGAYWVYATGGLIMYAGFLTTQGANKAAWTGVDLLNNVGASPGTGQDYWIIGVTLATLGVILQAACILATIVRSRVPGMTMLRLPVFCWGELVAVLMVMASFPVLILTMVFLYLDRHGTSILTAETFEHLFWFYGHPVVYVVFFPFIAAVGEIVATFAGKRFFGYRAMVMSFLAFAALSVSVWGHHMFTMGITSTKYFALTTLAIIVPAGIEYFDMMGTMWGGKIRLRAPMLFAIGMLLTFLIGGLTGMFVASPPLDYHVHETYFVIGHFHYTLFGATVFGLFAAVYYWFPKVTGRCLGETLGRWHAGLMFVGAQLTFLPMFFLGHDGMVRRVADYPADAGWNVLNIVATIGAVTLFLSFAIFILNAARSLRLGLLSGNDPWGGHTLEWWTTSPPPRHNFETLPPVRSYAPLLDVREGDTDWDPGAERKKEYEGPHGEPPKEQES